MIFSIVIICPAVVPLFGFTGTKKTGQVRMMLLPYAVARNEMILHNHVSPRPP